MGLVRSSMLAASFVWLSGCGGAIVDGDAGIRDRPGSSDGAAGDETGIGEDGGALSCVARTAAASALVQAASEAAEKDRSCKTDADCVVVWAVTDCSDQCSDLASRAGAEKINAAIEEANRTVCRGFDRAGCMLIHPPCAPLPTRRACVTGMCFFILG